MGIKKLMAVVLALWLGLCPAPAYAGIGDAFDLAGAAISSLFRKDVDKTAKDIMQTMENDPAQKKILREHLQKTEEYDQMVESAGIKEMFLQKIPLIGGVLSWLYFGAVTTYCEHCVADDSHEIIVKFEDLRSDYWDAIGDLQELVKDVDFDSTLSKMNVSYHWKREESLEAAIKMIKAAALSEDVLPAMSQSGGTSTALAAKDAAEKYRSLARQCGLDGDITSLSKGAGDGSGICLIRTAGRDDRYLIYNAADGITAVVAGGAGVNQIKNNRDGQYAASFLLDIYNAPRSHDAAAGVWKGTMHRMPLLVKYEVKNGEVIPGMITTANGTESSAQCTEVLYETRNVTTINLLLTEMRSLR